MQADHYLHRCHAAAREDRRPSSLSAAASSKKGDRLRSGARCSLQVLLAGAGALLLAPADLHRPPDGRHDPHLPQIFTGRRTVVTVLNSRRSSSGGTGQGTEVLAVGHLSLTNPMKPIASVSSCLPWAGSVEKDGIEKDHGLISKFARDLRVKLPRRTTHTVVCPH